VLLRRERVWWAAGDVRDFRLRSELGFLLCHFVRNAVTAQRDNKRKEKRNAANGRTFTFIAV